MKQFSSLVLFVLLSFHSFSQTIISQQEYDRLKRADKIYQVDGTDIIVVPEEKMNEFLKTYQPKQTQKLNKPTNITLDGYIADGITSEPLNGIKVIYELWTDFGPYDTLETLTNFQGYFSFMIVNIEDVNEISNVGIIEYFSGNIRITATTQKRIKLITYDILGQKINTIIDNEINGSATFNLGLRENQPILSQLEIDGKTYSQIHIKLGNFYGVRSGKEAERILKNHNKQLDKIIWVGGLIYMLDSTNQYHGYSTGTDQLNENTQMDFSLIPRINLEYPIIDPDYTIIPTITTLRDLWWYMARVQGDWDNKLRADRLFPIKLFTDSIYAPNGGLIQARNVIKYFQDSLDIPPDSLIEEIFEPIEPSTQNGFSAAKIVWSDSTLIGSGYYSGMELIFSGSSEKFIGVNIFIDTNKVYGEDIGKYLALQLQKYATVGINYNNNPNYLSYTTNSRIGVLLRPNDDEKRFIKNGRFTKPFYTNRVYP